MTVSIMPWVLRNISCMYISIIYFYKTYIFAFDKLIHFLIVSRWSISFQPTSSIKLKKSAETDPWYFYHVIFKCKIKKANNNFNFVCTLPNISSLKKLSIQNNFSISLNPLIPIRNKLSLKVGITSSSS